MEIEAGEYIRTSIGYIGKYIRNSLAEGCVEWQDNEGTFITGRNDIVKHSKNIIDLIEVGDYVNGELVVDIQELYDENEKQIGRKIMTQYRIAQFNGLDMKYYIYQQDIKSIVTKEQFKSVEYEV